MAAKPQSAMWMILCGAYGALIGHASATICWYNNVNFGPVPELCCAVGFLVGAMLGIAVDFVARGRDLRSESRALWILFSIAVLTYILLLPAFRVARE